MALLFELKQKLSQGFLGAWKRYPNKNGKVPAQRAWNKKVTAPEIEAKVHGALDWQIPYWQTLDWYHPPMFATYLNQERWEDEPPTTTVNRPTAKVTPIKPLPTMAEQQLDARNRIRSLIATGMDPEEAKQQIYREMGWIKE